MSIFGKRENVITYTVNKAINKNMYITVQNGEVVVNAPWYFTSSKIQTLVQEKKNWILNKIEEYEKSNKPNIQTVKIFGKNYDVKVIYQNIKTPELNLEENYQIKIILPIKYKKIGNEKILEMSIEKMYEQIANTEVDMVMEKIRLMLGIAPEEYSIKKLDNNELAKCMAGKMITIDPKLMKYKKEIIEYVIAHEFCHLKYKTHCRSFYEMLENHFPNYNKIENELEELKF